MPKESSELRVGVFHSHPKNGRGQPILRQNDYRFAMGTKEELRDHARNTGDELVRIARPKKEFLPAFEQLRKTRTYGDLSKMRLLGVMSYNAYGPREQGKRVTAAHNYDPKYFIETAKVKTRGLRLGY